MSLRLTVLLACCFALAQHSSAQNPNDPVIFRYNIGGPGLFGYIPEQRGWISSPNTKLSILNEPVSGTIPGFALKTHRWAQFSYTITIPFQKSGIYSCSLYWAETSKFFRGPGKRVFNIILNGRRLNRIDVFASVGWRAQYSRTINNVRVDNVLRVRLEKVVGDPYLSAVICRRTALLPPPGLPPFFNLNVGGPSIQGNFAEKRSWVSSTNTFTTFTVDRVSGSKPQFFLGTHRWAQISYSIRIPIAQPGRYFCTCFWAETSPFFRQNGKRVFNIVLNGRRINNIDVHKAVGFLNEYKRSIGNIWVSNFNRFLTVRLEKVKGDPYLAGLQCSKNN